MTCYPIKFFAVCALVTLCIAALPLPSRTWARSRSVPVLLVHGFQTGAINPLTHRAPVTDPRDDWKALCLQLTKERICRFIPVPVTDARGQRLWSFWQVQGHPVYVSNYTENTRITSLTCIGVYASLLAEEIKVIKQREHASRIDIVAHSMGGLVSRAYIERSDFREGDGALLIYAYAYARDVRKLIMLGTPNHGTPLTEIATILGIRLDKTPAFSVKQMHPGSKFLRLLNRGRTGSSLGVEYSAIAGNKCQCSLWDKLWAEVRAQIGIEIPAHVYCELFEKYYRCGDNDMVVATESVRLSEIPSKRYKEYLGIDHVGLLNNSKVIGQIELLLR